MLIGAHAVSCWRRSTPMAAVSPKPEARMAARRSFPSFGRRRTRLSKPSAIMRMSAAVSALVGVGVCYQGAGRVQPGGGENDDLFHHLRGCGWQRRQAQQNAGNPCRQRPGVGARHARLDLSGDGRGRSTWPCRGSDHARPSDCRRSGSQRNSGGRPGDRHLGIGDILRQDPAAARGCGMGRALYERLSYSALRPAAPHSGI